MTDETELIHWCTYSEEGLKRLRPRKPYRIGIWMWRVNHIQGWQRNSQCVKIRWLGCKCPTEYAESYIRIFASSEPYKGELPEIPVIPHLLQSRLWHS